MDNKRTQFGNRNLDNENDVYNHNAWDNVVWTDEIKKEVNMKVNKNSEIKLSTDIKNEKIENSSMYWNSFYDTHENNFFKDRHWLTTEFPDLINESDDKISVFEIGCGVGNTIFPLLKENKKNSLYLYGCDFSEKAIDVLKTHELYNEENCKAFVADITNIEQVFPFEENSLDIITMIFVLSALSPAKMKETVKRILRYLKPGGLILFRDYGQYDLAQVRFKTGHCLEDNFYVRGDGTLVYFFNEDEIRDLFTLSGDDEDSAVIMETVQLYTDRRLIVNRARQNKMYRVWLTGKFRKL